MEKLKTDISNIKYILWDVDGTLIDFDKSEVAALHKCFKDFNLGECNDEKILIYKQINNKYWKKLEKGEISRTEVMKGRFYDFLSFYGLDTSCITELNVAYQTAIGDEAVYNEKAEETIKKLSKKYKQYGATNGSVIAQRRKLSKTGLDNLLEDVFISEEIGYDKPSYNYFKAVFNKIGSNNLDEYLIIGDSLTSDIQGGNNSGIKTCWFNPKKKEKTDNFKVDFEIQSLEEILDILL